MSRGYEQRRRTVGEIVFNEFDKNISNEHLDEQRQNDRLEVAAELASEMPFVTMPYRENGIILPRERNTHLLHVFQPNLWAQDYAHGIKKLSKMTVGTAIERANASALYVIETSPSVRQTLKRVGKKEYDFYTATREASMVESAYYTRLGNSEMPDVIKKKIDIALFKRTYKNMPLFKTVVDTIGVNGLDGMELLDFASEIDLTDSLQSFIKNDPYYSRRSGIIESFGKMNAESSARLASVNTESFFEEMIFRAMKRFPSMVDKLAKLAVEEQGQGGARND